MAFSYTKKEIKTLLVAIFILSFVFGFNDGRSVFILSDWLTNFVRVFFIVAIGLIIYDFAHDFFAQKQGFLSEFSLWGFKRLNFNQKPTFPKKIKLLGKNYQINSLPIGIILAVLVTLFSNGQLYWAAVSSYNLITLKSHRLGKKYITVTDFQDAKIAISGSIALAFFIIFLKLFNSSGIFDQAIFIYSVIAIYNLLPLPGLDGFKVIIASAPLYISGLAFVICTVLFVYFLNAFFAFILAFLISGMLGGSYIYLKMK